MIGQENKILFEDFGYQTLRNYSGRVWDGEVWTDAEITEQEPMQLLKISLKDGSSVKVTADHLFAGRLEWLSCEKHKWFMMTYPVEEFEARLDNQQIPDRYDLGVVMAKTIKAENQFGTLVYKIREKDFETIRELKSLLRQFGYIESYTEYRTTGNLTVIELDNKDLIKYNKEIVPSDVYKSYSMMRGYLRGLFDGGRIDKDTLKIGGHSYFLTEIRDMLKLFQVRSYIDRGLNIQDIRYFFRHIGVMSDTLIKNVHKIWDGYQPPEYYKTILKVIEVEKTAREPVFEVKTSSGKVMVNGLITNGIK